jgi:hypothetical protein
VKGHTVQGHQPPHCASRETEEANMTITIEHLSKHDVSAGRWQTTTRWQKDDRGTVHAAAALLGMTTAAFIRSAAYQVAEQVLAEAGEVHLAR